MIRGLYTSGWSMLAGSKQMDTISNNLANVNTNGYKRDTIVYEAFPDALIRRINDTRSNLNPSGRVGNVQLGNDVGEVFTFYRQGAMMETNGKFDMAIGQSNSAFFTVAVPDNQGNFRELYTRDGAFVLNADNYLVTKEGYPVMGVNGPVILQSEDFSVLEDGRIVEGGQEVNRLLIKDFTDTTTLRKIGSNLVEATENTEEKEFTGIIKQGYLEQSNVNAINEMISMITTLRAYEANQKVLQAQDSTLERVVNEVGVVR